MPFPEDVLNYPKTSLIRKSFDFISSTFDFFLFGHVLISIAAACQGMLTYLLLGIMPDYRIIAVLFLSTFAVYNFSIIRFDLKTIKSDGSPRLNILSSTYTAIKVLIILAFIALIPFAFHLKKGSIYMLIVLGTLSMLYSLNFLPYKGRKISLRKVPGAKMLIISLIWTFSTVWFPAFESSASISGPAIFLLCLKRFLFTSAACITFDIKDIFHDQVSGLSTIPALIGIQNSKFVCVFLLVLYSLLLFAPGIQIPFPIILGLLSSLIIEFFLVMHALEKRSDYFFFVGIDGMFVMQYMLAAGFCFFAS